jgi:hypothetical protein
MYQPIQHDALDNVVKLEGSDGSVISYNGSESGKPKSNGSLSEFGSRNLALLCMGDL